MKNVRIIGLVVLAAMLPACGFKPMYGAKSTGPAITQNLAAIAIDPVEGQIDGRVAQQVRNALLDRVTPLGTPASPRYRLTVTVTEDREGVGLRQDASVTRINISLNGQFQLTDAETAEPVFSSSAWVASAYDVTLQDFSTVTAQQAAERRLAVDLAEEIRTLLALHFSEDTQP